MELIIFPMPNTNNPKIEEWVGFLQENIRNVDEETYFIGHSIGCQTILRYLETLPEGKKVGGCVFVAGWYNLKEECYEEEEERDIAKPWLETPMDRCKIKSHCDNFLAIFSTDDDCVPLSDAELFQERLQAKVLIKQKEGHFNMTEKIPEILSFID
jgi:predicted alpha/beta hydrolase family esterase